MNFKQWLEQQEFSEIFDRDNIVGFQSKDGGWVPDLQEPSDVHKFRFNVSGDDEQCRFGPCYSLTIAGRPEDIVYISFEHAITGYSDRKSGVGADVMKSVLHGLEQYIKQWRPAVLSWAPVQKDSVETNVDARAKVYKLWATKHLFPDKYVPYTKKYWVRRDKYDQELVPTGLIAVPPGAEKKKLAAVEELINGNVSKRNEFNAYKNREITRRRERQEERQTQTQAQVDQRVLDRMNIHHFKVHDRAIIKQGEWQGQIATIQRFEVYHHQSNSSQPRVVVQISTDNGVHTEVDLEELIPVSDEHMRTRDARYAEIMRTENPEGLKAGDDVIWVPGNEHRDKAFVPGKVQGIAISQYAGRPVLSVSVLCLGFSSRPSLTGMNRNNMASSITADIKAVKKDTPQSRAQAEEQHRNLPPEQPRQPWDLPVDHGDPFADMFGSQ